MMRLKPIYHVVLDVYNWLLPLVVINILWVLMSFTVILLPPATAALYEIACLAARGEGPQISRFLLAVRRWAVKSWLWGGVTGFILAAGYIALNVYGGMGSAFGPVLTLITTLILVFVSMVQFYFWPYMLLQDETDFRRAAHNALFTVLGDPLLPLLNVGLTGVALILGVVLIAPIIFIVPVFSAFLGVYSLRAWLSHHGLLDES
jgi:uncharacterized membrane protein YesL